MSAKVTTIDQITGVPTPDGIDWRPVRAHLGVTAFGTNAYVGRQAGDLVIEDHDEDEDEELYVVLTGAARLVVDGEQIDAPAGTLVLVTPPSRRVAHATAPDTTILVVGGAPGKVFEVSGWETRYLGGSAA